MTVETIPQREALRLYLVMIAGREPAGSYFEIRAKRVTGRGMDQDFIPLHDADRAARVLLNRGQMTDTYLGVAPRTERKGDLSAIERVWCLHADCDSRDSLLALAAFDPLPSIVVRSGTEDHAHAYWPLRSPVTPAWAKRGNQRLALKLGADRNATDAARIMRPPGTYNHKHADRRPVVCTRFEPVVFELGDVVGALPDEQRQVPRATPRVLPARSSGRTLDALVRVVREATPKKDRNSRLYWAACRASEHARTGRLDAAAATRELRAAAISVGLDEVEIDATIRSAFSTEDRAAA